MHLKQLDPFIGGLELKQVHMGSLQDVHREAAPGWREDQDRERGARRRAPGLESRLLRVDGRQGMTWLETAPKIKLFAVKDARSPYPLTDEEQSLLFQELPDHLARMALFKVNTGLREQEVCGLKWD